MPCCSQNHEALFVCDTAKCRRECPFVCNQNGCECHQVSHKECSLISWKKFTQDLNSPDKYRMLFKEIIDNLEATIAYSERMNEIMKEELIKCKVFFSKNEDNRSDILRIINDLDFKKLLKSHIVEYQEFFRVTTEQSKLKDIIVKNVKVIKENQEELQKYFKQIYEGDADLINSKIISSVQQVGKFFTEKIKYIKLLYRASDRGFSTDKFHQLCDNIPNTVVLVQTQYDKVFGGFSPCVWTGVGASQDTTEQSFIFSITHDEKMEIINPRYSIFNCVKVGPIFGGGNSMMADIEICDKADTVRKSGTNFPVNYNNSNGYIPGQPAVEHLAGPAKGRYFLLKEWEVFEVAFESDTQVSAEHFLA